MDISFQIYVSTTVLFLVALMMVLLYHREIDNLFKRIFTKPRKSTAIMGDWK